MNAMRAAAAVLLEELRGAAESSSELQVVQIERLTCEVQGPRRTELVSLRLEDGRLQSACTCTLLGCVHVRAVLQLMASDSGARESGAKFPVRVEHAASEPLSPLDLPAPAATSQLAEALADVVTAVVRSGVCSERVASVWETLSRVERALPQPQPLGLLRWLGQIREAIDAQDPALAAQALSAAAALAADLRSARPSAEARVRLASWFGGDALDTVQRLSDRSLVEVAREWVNGTARNQIERRYLIDLDSGEFFREECVRGKSMSSVGPCPRLIGVSLAEVEPGCSPRRLRLLQYTTTPNLQRAHWDNLAAWGQRDSEALLSAYHQAVSEFGALAEPFALTAPRSLKQATRPSLVLDRGAPLPLFADEDPGALRFCERTIGSGTPVWVAGRLVEHGAQMMLRPLSFGMIEGPSVRYARL